MPFQFTPSSGLLDATAFPTTPANETAGRQQFMTIFDQIKAEINSGATSAIGYHSMARQAIANGNFDIWQKGTSFTNPTDFICDRWNIGGNNPDGGSFGTITVVKEKITPAEITGASSYNIVRITTAGSGTSLGPSSEYAFDQNIEYGTRYLCGAGRKLTLSFWARSSIAGKKIGAAMYQHYGSGGTPSALETINGSNWTLTSNWTKCTFTFSTNNSAGKTFGTNNDDYLIIRLYFLWGANRATNVGGGSTAETFRGAGTIDIAQVQFCSGDSALPFQPRTYAEEEALSLRFNRRISASGLAYGQFGMGAAASTTQAKIFIPFGVRMRRVPTVVYSGNIALQVNGTILPVTSIVTDGGGPTKDGVFLNVNVASGLTGGNAVALIANNDLNAYLNFDAEI